MTNSIQYGTALVSFIFNILFETSKHMQCIVVLVICLSYLQCCAGMHSSFPAASAAPPEGEATPPTDGILAALACAAAISSTAQIHRTEYIIFKLARVNNLIPSTRRFKTFQTET